MDGQAAPGFGGETALIADDDEFFRVALSSVLSGRLGFRKVIETATFDAAVEQLTPSDDVDLALFDLNMPGMNNWKNLRTIRECFPSVRVAVVSASQDRHDILMALSIGLHGYVYKGLGVAELGRAIGLIREGMVYVPAFFPDLPVTGEEPDVRAANGAEVAEPPAAISSLTPRQKEVLELLVAGKSNKGMARDLDLSEGTIKFHLAAVFRVLGATNRVEAATAGARLLRRTGG